MNEARGRVQNAAAAGTATEAAWERVERELRAALRDIRYGSLEIVIHDARIVQIERRQKVRFHADDREQG